jgi:hypothetical protein
MLRDRGMVHNGSLRPAMARYAERMERCCNYCWLMKLKLTIVVAVERMSGPPFLQWACDGCMASRGLKRVL